MQTETSFNDAIIKKYPEQVVIVLIKEKSGRINPVTIGWTMLTSHEPPMMAFSLGKDRYSAGLIEDAGCFVISFPSEEMEKETLLFGTKSGKDTDKLSISGVATSPAKKIDCVILNDAVANFECRFISVYPTGDHIIFIGEIIHSHINTKDVKRLFTVAKGFKMSGITVKNK
jgi:flavin reductase (DIM6/NTAB) family NADH-FMN oxidoreductase RutF